MNSAVSEMKKKGEKEDEQGSGHKPSRSGSKTPLDRRKSFQGELQRPATRGDMRASFAQDGMGESASQEMSQRSSSSLRASSYTRPATRASSRDHSKFYVDAPIRDIRGMSADVRHPTVKLVSFPPAATRDFWSLAPFGFSLRGRHNHHHLRHR